MIISDMFYSFDQHTLLYREAAVDRLNRAHRNRRDVPVPMFVIEMRHPPRIADLKGKVCASLVATHIK